MDGDGDLDIWVANGGVVPQPNRVWLNDGSGAFMDGSQDLGNASSEAAALGDLDGDGDLDAAVANTSPNRVWLNVPLDFGDARLGQGDSH